MKKALAILLICGLFAGCSSKDKDGETGVAVGDATNDSSVATSDISFDPKGSDSGNISGLSTVNFAYDSANLSSESRTALASNADWIKANSNVVIQIEGHCDKRGSVEYNLALGERRAKTVKNYLVNLGVDSSRLTIISYGKEKPLVSGDTEGDFYRNRRANFVPLPR